MASTVETANFNRLERIVEGWYWLMPSRDLRKGRVQPARLMGRDLAVYRTDAGDVVVLDAYCPHMGAHLAEGSVEGSALRCFFHAWKFERDGELSEVPCHRDAAPKARVRSWPVEERYGLVWVWTGTEVRHPVPHVLELPPEEHDARLGSTFTKKCHPNVMMINAIDQQHFWSVHMIPNILRMESEVVNDNCIHFANEARVPKDNWFGRFISRFYANALTYTLTYWNGHTGIVTVGPDFMHFWIIFALRVTDEGHSEGQTILVTNKRKGLLGWAFNRVVFILTSLVGNYFARGDTRVFSTIRFSFKTPVRSDRPIVDFVRHYDQQKTYRWRQDAKRAPVAVRFGDSWRKSVANRLPSAGEGRANSVLTAEGM